MHFCLHSDGIATWVHNNIIYVFLASSPGVFPAFQLTNIEQLWVGLGTFPTVWRLRLHIIIHFTCTCILCLMRTGQCNAALDVDESITAYQSYVFYYSLVDLSMNSIYLFISVSPVQGLHLPPARDTSSSNFDVCPLQGHTQTLL